MTIMNIAGYKFIQLVDAGAWVPCLRARCEALCLKGTILLSAEGINLSLAGETESIVLFKAFLAAETPFVEMRFHETYSATVPFKQLKVKLKKEIITLKCPEVDAVAERAPSVAPALLKQWLDEGRDITLLDTRNDYEIDFGTFNGAVNLHLENFSDLPATLDRLDRAKPIVMFCTGGIRCEKAALYMQQHDFKEVYQLDGGILGYFSQVGGAHYTGACFIFDERVAISSR